MNGRLKRLLRTGSYLYSVILLIFAAIALANRQYGLALAMALAAVAVLVFILIYSRQRARDFREYIRQSVDLLDEAGAGNTPFPLLTLDCSGGEILWHNKEFSRASGISDTVIGTAITDLLPGFSMDWIAAGKPECDEDQVLKGRRYRIFAVRRRGEQDRVLLCFIDATELLDVGDAYLRSRPVVSIILIDNYDELTNNLPDSTVSSLNAALNERIGAWSDGIGGLLRRLERNRFLFLFEAKDLYRITDGKFALLDSIREVTNPAGVAATISFGIGKDGGDFRENYEFAALALEMALSRGGDQAVIKDKFNFSFFGGRARETERRTKVKSRVMAGLLSELIAQSSRVFIMGHKNADADAIGAAAGLCAICRRCGKSVSIVTDLKANAAGKLIARLQTEAEYRGKERFVTGQDAMVLADAKSLLIIVDTNRPDQVEHLPLLESVPRIAIIDHHRRAADYINRAALALHEPYASSTAELVTELLMYTVEKEDLLQVELEALLAGIVLDTKNFGVRVNSRTFEAAAFLRKHGADTVDVKKLFQSDFETTVARYRIIQSAQVYRERIAVASVEEQIGRVLAGQAADELLNIDGIDCSFVLFRFGDAVYISGRSIGDINVQMVLETLGGGGNAATAGAQVRGKTPAEVTRLLAEAIDRYFDTK